MSTVALILACVAALLVISVAAIFLARSQIANAFVYGAACIVTTAALVVALGRLINPSDASSIVLPFGLPWLGAHFRIDALSSLFLVVVNLGGAAASLYGIGYG